MKRCIICNKEFEPKTYPNSTIKVKWCSSECGYIYANQKQAKKAKSLKLKQENFNKLYTPIAKQSKTSYTSRLNYARSIFQAWIRERDKNEPCISCGTYYSDSFQGGHYMKAEIYPNVIFNEDNVHKQCKRCNRDLHGNEASYAKGLMQKIGAERLMALMELASKKEYKYTDDQLEAIKKKYKKL